MGHQSNVRVMRRQVRNVAQQLYPTLFQEEAVQQLHKKALEVIADRLDKVAENVDKEVKRMDAQTEQFKKFLMLESSRQISAELTNIMVSNVAMGNVLAKKSGFDMAEFGKEVDEEKKFVYEKLAAEAKAREEKEAAERKAAEEAKVLQEALDATADLPEEKPAEETAAPDAEVEQIAE